MSVQRIVSIDNYTRGWQARVYTVGTAYLSAFFADKKHGGSRAAKALAKRAELKLKRAVRRGMRG